jgi:molybdopterin-guanine dinucleotide biosynthesis protein A
MAWSRLRSNNQVWSGLRSTSLDCAASSDGAGDVGVVILGGGEATRLPGKLELAVGQAPLIVRVFRNVSLGRVTFISCKGTFGLEVDALLPCPMVVDRWARRGPLAGMLSTMLEMRSRYVFAVAGDAPFITSAFIDRLAARIRPGDQAVVPRHTGGIEPLAAIYERTAFLRAGLKVLQSGQGALRLVIDALRTNYVDVGDDDAASLFANINTAADYTILPSLAGSPRVQTGDAQQPVQKASAAKTAASVVHGPGNSLTVQGQAGRAAAAQEVHP